MSFSGWRKDATSIKKKIKEKRSTLRQKTQKIKTNQDPGERENLKDTIQLCQGEFDLRERRIGKKKAL